MLQKVFAKENSKVLLWWIIWQNRIYFFMSKGEHNEIKGQENNWQWLLRLRVPLNMKKGKFVQRILRDDFRSCDSLQANTYMITFQNVNKKGHNFAMSMGQEISYKKLSRKTK